MAGPRRSNFGRYSTFNMDQNLAAGLPSAPDPFTAKVHQPQPPLHLFQIVGLHSQEHPAVLPSELIQ